MVTRSIQTGVQLAQTVEDAVEALRRIQQLRKSVDTLRKQGMGQAATALEKECNFNEACIKRSLGKKLVGRSKARSNARKRSRGSGGRFR